MLKARPGIVSEIHFAFTTRRLEKYRVVANQPFLGGRAFSLTMLEEIMKNSIGIIMVTAVALFLTGCAAAPDRIVVETTCDSGGDCEATARAEWELKSGGKAGSKSLAGFDPSLVTLDFSNSSDGVSVTTSSGYAVIKVTSGTGQVNTNAFSWSLVGESIIVDDPFGVEAWIDAYFDEAVEIEVDYGSFQTTEASGANTLVAESVYGNQVQAGDAASWYVTPPGGGGPPQQQR